MRKKAKGMLDDFLPIVIFILLMAVLMFLNSDYNAAVNQKTELNAIGRKYILRVETYGYLTQDDQKRLANELNEAGFYANKNRAKITESNIANCLSRRNAAGTLEKTTLADVGYGKEVKLVLNVYTDVSTLKETNIMKAYFKKDVTAIAVTYNSTSKE